MRCEHRFRSIRRYFACLLVAAATAQTAAASKPPDHRIDDQMRADCRAEGEAGGLEGTELEAFIRGCINDLLTVEIGHTEEP